MGQPGAKRGVTPPPSTASVAALSTGPGKKEAKDNLEDDLDILKAKTLLT